MNDAVKITDVQKGMTTRDGATQALVAASPFSSIQAFEAAQRMAFALTSSSMVPKEYQGKDNLGNALIALEVAQRTKSSILMVMQNLYNVHGRPSWSGQYVIAAINQCGRFAEPLHFEFVGEEDTDSWGCYATTVTRSGRQIKGPTITIALAKKEGWYSKKDRNGNEISKWQTMPELMLRYRAAAWFGRTECPEILMGMPTAEEEHDILDIDPDTGEVIGHGVKTRPGRQGQKVEKADETADQDAEEPDGDVDEPQNAKGPGAASEALNERWEKELKKRGYYQDGNRFFNAKGERWNPDIHAQSKVGDGPIVNKDGSFRAKPGAKQEEEAKQGGESGFNLD